MNGSGNKGIYMIRAEIILIYLLFLNGNTFCQSSSYLKPELQVILFQKIFKYMNSVDETKKLRILVVFQNRSSGVKETVNAFKSEGFTVNSTDKSEFESVITNYDLVYLMPDVSLGNKRDIPGKYKILTITGDPYLVAAVDAAVGVGIENSKPAIYLNLSTIKSQSHEVTTDLINLAKIYK